MSSTEFLTTVLIFGTANRCNHTAGSGLVGLDVTQKLASLPSPGLIQQKYHTGIMSSHNKTLCSSLQ